MFYLSNLHHKQDTFVGMFLIDPFAIVPNI